MTALITTAMLLSSCDGGGGSDKVAAATPTPVGSNPTPTPTPAPINSDVATLADIEACPLSTGVATANWYTVCLVGKRLPGADPITGEACELRLKVGGVFEYAKNGVVLTSTPPTSQWVNASGDYRNELTSSEVRLFNGQLSGGNSATNTNDIFAFSIYIRNDKRAPTNQGSNEDTVNFTWTTAQVSGNQNCKLNNI